MLSCSRVASAVSNDREYSSKGTRVELRERWASIGEYRQAGPNFDAEVAIAAVDSGRWAQIPLGALVAARGVDAGPSVFHEVRC